MRRGNYKPIGQERVTLARLREDMAAFDELPPTVRRVIAEAPLPYKAQDAKNMLTRLAPQYVAQIIAKKAA